MAYIRQMLLVLCVDLDDDLGRKTGLETPVVGRDVVERAAVELATSDPEDSDVNVLFQGIHEYEDLLSDPDVEEDVEVAAVTGTQGGDVKANRAIGEEVDRVLAGLSTGENVSAIVITDGAQDESVLPIVRSRVPIDSVRRVVVRQAQDLESIYYTMKQVLADPETRGTILVPLGILLLIYPFVTIASLFDVPGAVVLGIISALLGLYTLFRGLGLEDAVDDTAARVRDVLYEGRVTLITYVAAAALLVVGGFRGYALVESVHASGSEPAEPLLVLAALVHGAVQWFAAAGITSSLGQVTDEYLSNRFKWRYLNAPFYVVAIAVVLYVVSGFFLPPGIAGVESFTMTQLAIGLTAGTLLGVFSTLAFAIAESRFPTAAEATKG
jgi:putative membrane protein